MNRRIAQPLIVLPVATILTLTLFVVGLAAQLQPIVPDIGFEIEGNAALDHGGDYDWENAIPPAIRIPDPNSKITTDPDTFKPDSKFDDPAGWSILPGKVGPGQSELINFLVWDIPPGDLCDGRPDDYWLVLGMERIKVPGFFELDFEYNQAAWDGSSGGLTRTPGDVLVGFELRGKPTSKRAEYKVLLLQYWPGAQPSLCNTTAGPGGEPELVEIGTDPCPPYGDSGWYYRLLADDALSAESGLVQATMNTEAFSPPWPSIDDNGNPCDVIGPYEFAEAAINLTALGIEPDCLSPGSVHAKTRSAPHVCSDLKDLVGPVPVGPECEPARLDGHKFEDIDGDGLWGLDEPPLEGWEIRLSDGSVTHTNADGYYAFENLDEGTYTVSEVCPQGEEGWVQTMPTPDDPNSCGEAVYTVTLDSCTPEVHNLDFGNQWRPPPRLDGHKFFDSDEDGIWEQDEEHWPLEGWEIRLSDGSVTHTNADGYYAFEDLEYGTYTVSEVCPQDADVAWVQTAPELTDEKSCGTAVYTVELNSGTPEVNDLDFGNRVVGPGVLDITKGAQTTFTRTYLWTLDKTVDNPGPILLYPGDYAEVEYQVVAGLDSPAYVDSGWAVEGTITIENLGAAEVPLASVTDMITPGDIPVPVDCDDWIVPGLGSVTCTYGPVSLPDGADRTNTATVTAQGSAGEWTATAPIVFDEPTTEIDEMVNVEDSQWGAMGQAGWDETPRIFTYPWKIQATGDTCGLFEVPNTATLTTNDTGTVLTADANVQIFEVCEVTIVYEDLRYPPPNPGDPGYPEENDWDYNDLVVHVPISLTVSDDGDLEAVSFEATLEPIRTAFTHTVNLQLYDWFSPCGGTYTKKVTADGVITTETGAYAQGDSIEVIHDTYEASYEVEGFLVELRIDFVPEQGEYCSYDFRSPDPVTKFHGEWLFFDPWLTVYRQDLTGPGEPTTTYDINVILPDDDPEPRILTVPADWEAPQNDWVPIWEVYACVSPTVSNGEEVGPPIFTPFWWDETLCVP